MIDYSKRQVNISDYPLFVVTCLIVTVMAAVQAVHADPRYTVTANESLQTALVGLAKSSDCTLIVGMDDPTLLDQVIPAGTYSKSEILKIAATDLKTDDAINTGGTSILRLTQSATDLPISAYDPVSERCLDDMRAFNAALAELTPQQVADCRAGHGEIAVSALPVDVQKMVIGTVQTMFHGPSYDALYDKSDGWTVKFDLQLNVWLQCPDGSTPSMNVSRANPYSSYPDDKVLHYRQKSTPLIDVIQQSQHQDASPVDNLEGAAPNLDSKNVYTLNELADKLSADGGSHFEVNCVFFNNEVFIAQGATPITKKKFVSAMLQSLCLKIRQIKDVEFLTGSSESVQGRTNAKIEALRQSEYDTTVNFLFTNFPDCVKGLSPREFKVSPTKWTSLSRDEQNALVYIMKTSPQYKTDPSVTKAVDSPELLAQSTFELGINGTTYCAYPRAVGMDKEFTIF